MSDWATALFATLLNIVILIFGRHRIMRGLIPSLSKTPDHGFSNEGKSCKYGGLGVLDGSMIEYGA